MKNKKMKYYSSERIDKENAIYNIIIGERSNGKTYDLLKKAVENYTMKGKQTAIIRRYSVDFKGKRGKVMFSALVENGEIFRLTKGEFTHVVYKSAQWFFAIRDEETDVDILSEEPFAYAFSLSEMEHDKSTSYPKITLVIFDEFLTRGYYLPDEFVIFMNVISTIARERDTIKIYMLGNTVNTSSIYFTEMGLKHISKMKQGEIAVYEYGESGLKVAVELCGEVGKKRQKKASDKLFAFDNPKLHMITNGAWEMALYPHCPKKYAQKDILFTYFIEFEIYRLQCEIIRIENDIFTYIHKKTTPLKDKENDLIYCTDFSTKPNYRRKITKPQTDFERKIVQFFIDELVFYQDNEVGEIVRNYLNWCKTDKIS